MFVRVCACVCVCACVHLCVCIIYVLHRQMYIIPSDWISPFRPVRHYVRRTSGDRYRFSCLLSSKYLRTKRFVKENSRVLTSVSKPFPIRFHIDPHYVDN